MVLGSVEMKCIYPIVVDMFVLHPYYCNQAIKKKLKLD